ncbi:hypothetical protein F2Q68_00015690 [Brassica cretica]|uniref:Uncharacterized protein n=1 Tax=Brassica cretica TaxID=69181 RepID=A0A8S9HDS1_BRACR|nr:hypothetical protein F2Q68_00015690 [Brassica cretica]
MTSFSGMKPFDWKKAIRCGAHEAWLDLLAQCVFAQDVWNLDQCWSIHQYLLVDILGHLACSPRRASSPRDIFSKAKLAAREKKRAQLNQSQPVTWSIPSPPSQHDPSISIMCNMDAA